MHEACNVGDGKEGGMGVSRFPDIDEVVIAFIWKSTSGLVRVDSAKGAVLHRAVAERVSNYALARAKRYGNSCMMTWWKTGLWG